MRIVTSVATMQRLARHWQRQKVEIGLVPTMGYLHRGHLSLITRARRLVGPRGKVVVSIYVNPTQFGPREDFKKYPRDLRRDRELCRDAGTDIVFAPPDGEMYPSTPGHKFSTYVVEENLSRSMEGRSRPTHFRGVTTVVGKLFNIVLPDVAVFGAKDFQQVAVIKRMVRDLNFPVRVELAPTVREVDGLALSSRNQYLEGELRTQARALWQAITQARAAVRKSRTPLAARKLQAQLARLIEHQPAAEVDYIQFFAPDTLEAATRVSKGTHMALAVTVGTTRLIDNSRL